METYVVDFTTRDGYGGYVVVTAPDRRAARARARDEIIVNSGDRITKLTVR